MDDKPSLWARIAASLLIPLALVILLPILLLMVTAFYFLAVFHAVAAVASLISGRKSEREPALQKPHFLEAPNPPAPVIRDETREAP